MSHNDSVNESSPLISKSVSDATQIQQDLESRWNRWTSKGKAKMRGNKGKGKEKEDPKVLISVFEAEFGDDQLGKLSLQFRKRPPPIAEEDLESQVQAVRSAIDAGIYPKMIQTGSSGSYFARILQDPSTQSTRTVAVFKPKDEEPYGELNPKRVFLRKYFWWALGRPCLLPNFSAFSEVGASFLDERLDLNLVPRTRLIELSSPSFYYEYKDRINWEKHRVTLPVKLGSYQTFLNGYQNVSAFLRNHPWPTRPKSVMDQDLRDENRSHKKSRKKQKAYLRKCGSALKHFLLCRGGIDLDLERHEDQSIRAQAEDDQEGRSRSGEGDPEGLEEDSLYWTPENMREFRLELERLVLLDYLMRNTDRGLDNFMIKILSQEERFKCDAEGKTTLVLAAIDNSLAFPHKQPDGIRDYPYGWLWFPLDLLDFPFSEQTRSQFLPCLSSAAWWIETERGLKEIFMQDEGFQEKRFEKQMMVLRGQGWNIVQCLKSEGEGPLELCSRQKMLVKREVLKMSEKELLSTVGTKLSLEAGAVSTPTIKASKQAKESQNPIRSMPVKVSGGRGASSKDAINEEPPIEPRSLPGPDCSPWHQNRLQDDHQNKPSFHHSRVFSEDYYNKFNPNSKHGKRNAAPGLPRRPSLGIEMLEEIDKAAKKAKRPSLARTLKPFGKSRSSNDTGLDSRPRSLNEGSDEETSVKKATSPNSKGDPSNPDRLPRSIDGTLATASSNVNGGKFKGEFKDSDSSLIASIASLPPSRHNSANNVLDEEVRPRGRRRGLSIASFGTFDRSNSADNLHNDGDEDHGGNQVKVILERLETDSSKAWLSFF